MSNLFILDFETTIKDTKHYILKIGLLIITHNKQIIKLYSIPKNTVSNNYSFISNIVRYTKKYSTAIIYCHNLSKFDGPILLNIFNNIPEVKVNRILITNNQIISIEVTYNCRVMVFKDSLKLLPYSLKKLAKIFSTSSKQRLPYNPRADEIDLNKVVNYLKLDLEILGLILRKYYFLINSCFKLNIFNYYGSPSLTIKLFKAFNNNLNFTIKNKKIKKFIRKSYKGGILYSAQGTTSKAESYDINSLYSFSMLNKQPTGTPKLIKTKNVKKVFGFLKVKIISRKRENFPLNLRRKYFFSEEVKFLENWGVIFVIIKSYKFNCSSKLFNKFNVMFYIMKQENLTLGISLSKVMLNSLYGKLGMKENPNSFTTEENKTPLMNLITNNQMYTPLSLRQSEDFKGKKILERTVNSVAIASAVASYSRIFMYQHLTIKNISPSYIDTDSLILDSSTRKLLLNSNLGSFKKVSPVSYDSNIFVNLKSYILLSKKTNKTLLKGLRSTSWESLEPLKIKKVTNLYGTRWQSTTFNILTQTRRIGLTFRR